MRKLHFVHLAAGLFLATCVGAAQRWVVNRTDADIAADLRGTQVAVALARPSIVAGEPLMLTVTIVNETGRDSIFCADKACLGWTVRSPSGAAVSAWHQPRGGDILTFAAQLAPHASKSFTIVAPDTTGIAVPGSYEIAVRYAEPGWADRLGKEAEPRSFTVLPRDEAALARRARELSDAAASPMDAEIAAQALAVIRCPVAGSTLCGAMDRDPLAAKYLVPRLEASGDAEAVGCLVDRLGKGGLDATVIMAALGRMSRTQVDPALRRKMDDAIAGACALATPDMPWMKAACSKP